MGAIAKLKKGALLKEIAPTVDRLVDAVNSLLASEVKVTQTQDDKSTGKYLTADANTVLQLNLTNGLPPFSDLDQAKTYALVAEYNGVWKARWADVCAGGADTTLQLD